MNNKMESFMYATLGCIVNAIDKIGPERIKKYYLYFNIMYLIICIYIIRICNTYVYLGD